MLEQHQTTSRGSIKALEGPKCQVSGAFQCSIPVKSHGLGQHSHIDSSSNASSHHSGAIGSTVLAWSLQYLPILSLLACPSVGAEARDGLLLARVFPNGANSPSPIFFVSFTSIRRISWGCSTSDWLGSQTPRAKTFHKALYKS